MTAVQFETRGGITVIRSTEEADYDTCLPRLAQQLDRRVGVLLSSSYEYPNRYKRWDIGFVDPPASITTRGPDIWLRALNRRGRAILRILVDNLRAIDSFSLQAADKDSVHWRLDAHPGDFAEELRTRQPSVFLFLRALVNQFATEEDDSLGLYGAFGYDLVFQFEALQPRNERLADQRDLVLFIPDRLLLRDHERAEARFLSYDFMQGSHSTTGLERETAEDGNAVGSVPERAADHRVGEYADVVTRARKLFARGDLFEAVPSQTLFAPCHENPSTLFERLRNRNPAPYGFLINLGQQEHLVGASPEMFVRVNGRRVESCPISGTIARGVDPLADADQILNLLNSEKEASELTMCTDVDRNDKSRICIPGSVQVIARRQIEMYSRLIHTVDHVQGTLRENFDAIDAFLTHMWAVTVTGAPKRWAMQFIEDIEKSPRKWYGGAVGRMTFDGNMNTGLTLRTIRIARGVAEVRVGATLLFDSDPMAEESETRLKAAALLDAISSPTPAEPSPTTDARNTASRNLLVIDHQDSFVNTLANYFRQLGHTVTTWRTGFPLEQLKTLRPDLVVLSPGPGIPATFGLSNTIEAVRSFGIPVFGVCLGLQGIVEYYGGTLRTLATPSHGKSSTVQLEESPMFIGLPKSLKVGRYHSLHADPATLPRRLRVTATSEDGIIMAVEHLDEPVAAVQFHPESILTATEDAGLRILENAVEALCKCD